MPFRFRKTIKIGPVGLNIGKKGISSVSAGSKLGRVTLGKGGRRTASVNLPGGLSYQTTSKRKATADAPQHKRRWWLLWLA
jgi:hypothetical protein